MWSIFGTPAKIKGHDIKADSLQPKSEQVSVKERPVETKEKKDNGAAK